MNFYLLEATGSGNGTTPQQGGLFGSLLPILMLVVMFVAMYFLMIRPQKKKQKEEQKMRENLQIGDEILTIGGFYFKVVSIKEDSLIVESVSDHTKMKIAKWAIQQNMTVHDDQSGK